MQGCWDFSAALPSVTWQLRAFAVIRHTSIPKVSSKILTGITLVGSLANNILLSLSGMFHMTASLKIQKPPRILLHHVIWSLHSVVCYYPRFWRQCWKHWNTHWSTGVQRD